MSISAKITASSALFVVLLAGVLLYHLALVRSLVKDSREFSVDNFRAATRALELRQIVAELGESARKLRVTQDAGYEVRLADLEGDLTRRLETLKTLARPPQDQTVALLGQSWAKVKASSAYRLVRDETPVGEEAAGESDIRKHASAGQRARAAAGEELAAGAEAAEANPTENADERLAEGDCADGPDVDPVDAELCREFARLRRQAEAVLVATRQAIEHQVERSNEKSREAERFSRDVVAVALLLILLVSALTARSIKAPLRRFTAGTRAVADGKFFYHLDETSGDEFAGPAAAFNSMARRLGDLDRLKRDFLAHVSHELKTPIVAMEETNALLLEQLVGPLNDRQRRVVSLNLESARRLSAMISHLLDLSRMEAGALEYDFQENDLVEIVEIVREELAGRMREKGMWLEADLSPQPLMIHADRNRLIQVIENLYDNAVKFSAIASTLNLALSTIDEPPKHLPVCWRRQLGHRGFARSALLAVSDSGPGVPDEHKDKIFEKFHQVEKSQKKGLKSGVGLGLAISREIVEAHRGALWVRDNSGVGSTFFLMLPIDPRGASAAQTSTSEEGSR